MDDLAFPDQPERDDVDQHVVVERLVDVHVAAEIRHADRVPVGGDAVDHALRDVAAVRILEPAETQRVGEADHLGAHAQHVAHDPADPGRRAFERHHLRGVVVRLVRDHDAVALALPLAEMQDAGIFGRPLHHGRPFGRQLAQEAAAGLVRAMLAPLRVEREQLGVARDAPQVPDDRPQLVGRKRDADAPALGDQTLGLAREVAVHALGGTFNAASACSTAERMLACTSSTRPKTTVSSSANAFAHCSATTWLSAVAGARMTGVAVACSTMLASAPSPEPAVTISARANVASTCVTSWST